MVKQIRELNEKAQRDYDSMDEKGAADLVQSFLNNAFAPKSIENMMFFYQNCVPFVAMQKLIDTIHEMKKEGEFVK